VSDAVAPKPTDVVAVHEASSSRRRFVICYAAGIDAMIRTRCTRHPGIVVTDKIGVWADILVLPEDGQAARGLIAEYLASLPVSSEER
jgi:hypothetical protein